MISDVPRSPFIDGSLPDVPGRRESLEPLYCCGLFPFCGTYLCGANFVGRFVLRDDSVRLIVQPFCSILGRTHRVRT